MKTFNIQYNVGKIKYLISYHNGEKKNEDGSDFFDITIFKNKKIMNTFINNLLKEGYIERNY